jgi:Protein of unknown function (DUF3313)
MRYGQTLVLVLFVAASMFSVGCSAQKSKAVGFISDYSKLEPAGDKSMRYLAPDNALAGYSAFIIDPVKIHFHAAAKGTDTPREDVENLAIYMRGALVDAIADKYKVVSRPGPGVARVRIALTDVKKSSPALNVIPASKLAGSGLGGAAMEGEIIDSMDRTQLAALIESRLGERLSLEGLSKWGDAKAVIDGWAKRFRERLDEANGQ